MPITHSAHKRLRQDKKRTQRNAFARAQIDRTRKELKRLVSQKTTDGMTDKLRSFISLVDKARQKGVLKRNAAARTKSRIAKLFVKKP